MSVIVTIRINADGDRLEQWASENRDKIRGIAEQARAQGCIAHRFYGDGAGVMVLDEWPDAESFQAFFHSSMEEIGPMMQGAGAQGEPEVSFWHELTTHDEFGWGA